MRLERKALGGQNCGERPWIEAHLALEVAGAQTMYGLGGRSTILIGSLLRGNIFNEHGVDLQVVAGRLFLIHLPQRP